MTIDLHTLARAVWGAFLAYHHARLFNETHTAELEAYAAAVEALMRAPASLDAIETALSETAPEMPEILQ